jgi:hypothetical protein
MASEAPQSAFLHTLANLVGDLTDLVQKEIALARAEITAKITERVEAAAWFAAAGLLGFIVLLLLVEAAVFGLVAVGLAPGWSCIVVAIATAALAGGAYFYGSAAVRSDARPNRSLRQINEDIRTVKEQLS